MFIVCMSRQCSFKAAAEAIIRHLTTAALSTWTATWDQKLGFYSTWQFGRFKAVKSCWLGCACVCLFNTLRPRRNEQHVADDIFKRIFFNENVWISIKISMKFVPKGPINNIPALVQIMAWRRSGDKPLSEPMLVSLPTRICVTRPQWGKRDGRCSQRACVVTVPHCRKPTCPPEPIFTKLHGHIWRHQATSNQHNHSLSLGNNLFAKKVVKNIQYTPIEISRLRLYLDYMWKDSDLYVLFQVASTKTALLINWQRSRCYSQLRLSICFGLVGFVRLRIYRFYPHSSAFLSLPELFLFCWALRVL